MEKYIRKIGKYIRSISGKEEKNIRKKGVYQEKINISRKEKYIREMEKYIRKTGNYMKSIPGKEKYIRKIEVCQAKVKVDKEKRDVYEKYTRKRAIH